MTEHEAGGGLPRDQYHDPVEVGRRPDGIRYEATLPDGTPVVAIAIAPEVAATIGSPERFLAALERAATIHDDAIERPLAWGRTGDGMLHVAYARPELGAILPHAGSMSPKDVAAIGAQLARGLAKLAQSGMVHGAIATRRIVHSPERGARITELGLFAALADGGLGVTEAAMLLADAPYVSPEAQSGRTPDQRSDVFSLGASLYELLTGKPPYGGRTTSYVMAAVLPDSGDAAARAIIDALLRAIEASPEDRWPSAGAFANALGGARGSRAAKMAAGARGCLPLATGALLLLVASAAVGALR